MRSDKEEIVYQRYVDDIYRIGKRFISSDALLDWPNDVYEWLYSNSIIGDQDNTEYRYLEDMDIIKALIDLNILDENTVGYKFIKEMKINTLSEELVDILRRIQTNFRIIDKLDERYSLMPQEHKEMYNLHDYINESIKRKTIGIKNIIEKLSNVSKIIYEDWKDAEIEDQHKIYTVLTNLSKYLGKLKEISIRLKALGVE